MAQKRERPGAPALVWKNSPFRLSKSATLAVVPCDLISFSPSKPLPALATPRSLLLCGKTLGIFGWSTARTIGSTFGRICSSGTESRLPRQTPSLPVRLLTVVLGPGAISAAKSISINPQKCSGSSKSLLSHSLHIRYFAMRKLASSNFSRCARARMAGSTQRGRVVSPACFQSFSHCQIPGVLSRTR